MSNEEKIKFKLSLTKEKDSAGQDSTEQKVLQDSQPSISVHTTPPVTDIPVPGHKNDQNHIQTEALLSEKEKFPLDSQSTGNVARKLLERKDGNERYEIKSKLAEGGMGIIKIVYDRDLERIVAMKMMPTLAHQNPEQVKTFIYEARITAQLEHPNIIPVHDLYTDSESGIPYYTMKLVEGESLLEIIRKLSMGIPEYIEKYNRYAMLKIFRKICDAIAYAHSRGIIHRDIKPENIMVGQFGEVLVLDWGLAKQYGRRNSVTSVKFDEDPLKYTETEKFDGTMDGMIKGSLAYISPEQAMGYIDQVDRLTDVFLLGATLYHMFTYFPPYTERKPRELILQAEKGIFPHPTEHIAGEGMPDTLVHIILKMMSMEKKNRYKSVEEVIEKLDDYMDGRTVSTFKSFNRGDFLIKNGEIGSETFVIVKGKVEVSQMINGEKIIINTLAKGSILGELAGITRDVRSADVMVLEETEVLIISHELLVDELKKLPPWMEKIVISLAERITSLNKKVHPYKMKSCAYPVLKQLMYIFTYLCESREGETTMSIEIQGLVREISFNLGLQAENVEKVLQMLKDTHLCDLNEFARFNIPNLSEFSMFLEFCRREFMIDTGITDSSANIDIERVKVYNVIFMALKTLV